MSLLTTFRPSLPVAAVLSSFRRTHLFVFLFGCVSLTLQSCGGTGAVPVQSGVNVPSAEPGFTEFDAPGAGTLAGQGTYAMKINAGGTIAGYFVDSNQAAHGFVRDSSGVITVFEIPGARTMSCCLGTVGQSINTSNTVAGIWNDNSSISHAFYRTQDGTITTFDLPDGYSAANLSINDSGAIAGTAGTVNTSHGFLRGPDGTISVFDAPDATQGTTPAAINSNGAITGYFSVSFQSTRGFLRAADGTLTEFDVPGVTQPCSVCGTEPADINANGAIVGVTSPGTGQHSFLRAPDGTFTVFDPPNAGGRGSWARAINSEGVIAGGYYDSKGSEHGYLLNLDGSFTTIDASVNSRIESPTTISGINASGASAGVIAIIPLDGNGTHGFLWQ